MSPEERAAWLAGLPSDAPIFVALAAILGQTFSPNRDQMIVLVGLTSRPQRSIAFVP